MNKSKTDTGVEHLPDYYDYLGDDLIPSSFKLDEAIRKDNPLTKYHETVVEEESNSPELVELENDFALARKNIKSVIDDSTAVLKDAIVLAGASDSPRSLEVVANLLKTITDMNKDLLALHDAREIVKKKRNERIRGEGGNTTVNNQQNNYFMASPSELVDRLKGPSE